MVKRYSLRKLPNDGLTRPCFYCEGNAIFVLGWPNGDETRLCRDCVKTHGKGKRFHKKTSHSAIITKQPSLERKSLVNSQQNTIESNEVSQ